MQTSHLAPLLQRERDDLKEENAKLRQTIREQGEFIQSMKSMIADFVYGKEARAGSLDRHLNGRG